jgi:hypothetical protein
MISTCATGVVKYSRTGVNPTSLGNPDVLSLHGSAKRKQEKQKKKIARVDLRHRWDVGRSNSWHLRPRQIKSTGTKRLR